jgi:hypothetical protein
LREVGGRGQKRICAAGATILSKGGLSNGEIAETAAQYLFRAGVGRLRVYAAASESILRLQELANCEGPAAAAKWTAAQMSAAPPGLGAAMAEAGGRAAESLTLGIWDEDPQQIYWAAIEDHAVTVGRGLHLCAKPGRGAAAPARFSAGHGATALLGGSALALCMLQGLLGISVPPRFCF